MSNGISAFMNTVVNLVWSDKVINWIWIFLFFIFTADQFVSGDLHSTLFGFVGFLFAISSYVKRKRIKALERRHDTVVTGFNSAQEEIAKLYKINSRYAVENNLLRDRLDAMRKARRDIYTPSPSVPARDLKRAGGLLKDDYPELADTLIKAGKMQ